MSTLIIPALPDKELEPVVEIESATSGMEREAFGLAIVDEESAGIASQMLAQFVRARNGIEEYFGTRKKQAHDLHKWIVDREKRALGIVAKPEAIVKQKLVDYHDDTDAKVPGVSQQTKYEAEVVDFPKLLAAVLAGEAPAECLTFDQKYLNGVAKGMKTAFAMPGCKLKTKRSARSTGR